MTAPERWTERAMLDLVHERYAHDPREAAAGYPPRYMVVEHPVEVAVGADHGPYHALYNTRILDALVLDRGLEDGVRHVHGIEVKVSRADWLRELRDPSKAAAWTRYCHRFWLAVPDRSIVRPGELPEGWGLLAPDKHGKLRARPKAALNREPEPLTGVADLIWRAIKTDRARQAREVAA